MTSITSTLGVGSGIDFEALVTSLVDAQYSVKNAALTKRQDQLTAQISQVSTLKGGIVGFSTGLSQLVSSGSLSNQAASGNTGIFKATTLAGASLADVNASIEVRALAAAQTAYTGIIADNSAALGQGSLRVTLGTATVGSNAITGFTAGSATPIDITIDSSNSSLTGIRDAINAAKAGVTASIVSDSGGYRLVLKGKTGAEQAFTIDATEDPAAPGLAALNVGVGASGTAIGTAAANAVISVDGVVLQRSSNSITDLVAGVRLDLVSASPGTPVSLTSSQPTDNLRQALNDFVSTYNDLHTLLKNATDPVTGSLHNDPAAKALNYALSQLTLKFLVPADGTAPRTLSDLGVGTNRDGTLTVDTARLEKVLTGNPAAVSKIFAAGSGLSSALFAVSNAATSSVTGLGASENKYTKAQSKLTDEQAKALTDAETTRTRLTRQFANVESRVAGYKATQAYLTQQFAVKSDN